MVTGEQRVLGFWAAVSIVMGNMIGSGVFLLPSSLAAYRGLSLGGWVVSAAGSLMLALVFARLARQLPSAGGPYAYTRHAFGDALGFLIGWGYWLSAIATLAALTIAGVGYLDPFIPAIVRDPVGAPALAIACIWVAVAGNVAGIVMAGRIQMVTTALKLLPLVIVSIGGLFYLRREPFELPAANPAPLAAQLVAAVTLTLYAFTGLECATIPADNVRDPSRTIPRATIVGTVAAALVYIVSTVAVMSLVGADALAASTAPFADAARVLSGDAGARAIAVGAAISCFGCLNGWTLITGQIPLAMAGDRLVPPFLGRLSSRGTPARSMIVAGAMASALVAMNSAKGLVAIYTFVILLSTLSTLVPYAFCAIAVWLMPGQPPPAGPMAIVSALAFVFALCAIGGAGSDTVLYGFLLLLAGLPLYVWVRRTDARPA